MNAQIIIDAIVRQTTVLIAQLATTAGARSPLSQVANQVFLDLARELERQGLSRKVTADMFGMALRSYQQKVERLSECASEQGMTLWEAVYSFISAQEVVGRKDVLRRFTRDDADTVKSILRDLSESGLIYQRGRGDESDYRVAPEADLARDTSSSDAKLRAIAWVCIFREGPLELADLARRLRLEPPRVEELLTELINSGSVNSIPSAQGETVYSTNRCVIPLGDDAGWEASFIDHYQTMVSTMCAKLRNGNTRALPPDQVGGSTYSFQVWRGHPLETEVTGLLAQQRQALSALRKAVVEHNERHARNTNPQRRAVTFYCGQLLVEEVESGET